MPSLGKSMLARERDVIEIGIAQCPLAELMADPLIGLVMKSDGVDRRDLELLLERVARDLARTIARQAVPAHTGPQIVKQSRMVYSAQAILSKVPHSLQIYGPGCGVFGRGRHRGKCGSRQYQCGGDGCQRRERFPIARPRSRGSPALHCDAASKQRSTAGDPALPGAIGF